MSTSLARARSASDLLGSLFVEVDARLLAQRQELGAVQAPAIALGPGVDILRRIADRPDAVQRQATAVTAAGGADQQRSGK